MEDEFDKKEKELLKLQAGWLPDSPQHAGVTADLEKLRRDRIRKLEDSQRDSQRKDKWRMFGLSQIIPLVALILAVIALMSNCQR